MTNQSDKITNVTTKCLFCEAALELSYDPHQESFLQCPKCETTHLVMNQENLDCFGSGGYQDVAGDGHVIYAFEEHWNRPDVDFENGCGTNYEYLPVANGSKDMFLVVAAWEVNETLKSAQVAQILDVKVDWVGKLASQGRISGTTRGEATKAEYSKGHWVFIKGDESRGVYEYLNNPKKRKADHTAPVAKVSPVTRAGVADELIYSLQNMRHQLSPDSDWGDIELMRPSVALDMMIIDEARAGSEDFISSDRFTCPPRFHLFGISERGEKIFVATLFHKTNGLYLSANALLTIEGYATGELWMLVDDAATLVFVDTSANNVPSKLSAWLEKHTNA